MLSRNFVFGAEDKNSFDMGFRGLKDHPQFFVCKSEVLFFKWSLITTPSAQAQKLCKLAKSESASSLPAGRKTKKERAQAQKLCKLAHTEPASSWPAGKKIKKKGDSAKTYSAEQAGQKVKRLPSKHWPAERETKKEGE